MTVNSVTVDDRMFISPPHVFEPRPPVLAAPVRPPTPSFHVIDRSALSGRLSRAVEKAPVTLINAPAGYGKTVLTASWAARRDRRFPVAWLTVTDSDEHVGIFWSHLYCALACAGVVVAPATQRSSLALWTSASCPSGCLPSQPR